MAPDASAVEVMSNSRLESFRFRIDSGSNRQSICSFDHLVGAGEQRQWDDEAKRVLAPGYKDKRQALIYPLFYVLLATKDIARSVRPRVSK